MMFTKQATATTTAVVDARELAFCEGCVQTFAKTDLYDVHGFAACHECEYYYRIDWALKEAGL